MNTQKKYIIQMENLCKAYDGRVILGDIDLKIAQGEFVTVVGPSGCGKSTLLRLILGMEKPTSATRFLVEGKEVEGPDITRGVVFQNYSLFPHLSVLGNILLGKKVYKGPWNYIENRKRYLDEAHFFLDKVGLRAQMHQWPGKLSGGQQERVAVAQALIMKQKLLVMDEPFSGLDITKRAQLQNFMRDIWQETGMTIIFVTHQIEEAFLLGSRVIALSQYFLEGALDHPNQNHGARIVFDSDTSRLRNKSDPAFGVATQIHPRASRRHRYVHTGAERGVNSHRGFRSYGNLFYFA